MSSNRPETHEQNLPWQSRACRNAAARRDPPIDVSTPAPCTTRGTHADDEPQQRQPEHNVPGCRDENATRPSVAFRD
ncbi:hypothetical protein Taro_055042 [Colocasia esculenta]|uniref:Uncharacterized protein n=1 Tax=Colocasia esculenta TaxID=4460 RepID=A0A843XT03_COLES|nr:hypothetical protein [Colocasia esculenta]